MIVTRSDLATLICIDCGRPLLRHHDWRNERIDCAAIFEREQAAQSTTDCTTPESAREASARLLQEGRY